MPFPLHLFNPQSFPRLTPRRVTLVRFVRAVAGFAAEDASDPDDRGFNLDPAFANVHGPAFGIIGPDGTTPAQQCRIRVMRDRIEPAAQLFPEVGDTTLVTLVSPATGAPLAPGDIITVRAARAPVAATSTTLKLHHGSASGPVVGECAIRVCPLITIPAKGHLVTINGGTPVSTEQTFKDLLANANKMLIAAGIRVDLQPGIQNDSHADFTTANTVTLPNTDPWDDELAKTMRRFSVPGVLNIYMVGHIDSFKDDGTPEHDNVRGVGISSQFANSNRAHGTYVGAQVGFLLRDPDDLEGFGATFAHELGHVLTLEHYNNKNGKAVQHNNWSARNLMYNFANLRNNAPANVVGYGNHNAVAGGGIRRGMFIGIKQLSKIFQSQQSDIMRTAALNGTFLPI